MGFFLSRSIDKEKPCSCLELSLEEKADAEEQGAEGEAWQKQKLPLPLVKCSFPLSRLFGLIQWLVPPLPLPRCWCSELGHSRSRFAF